MQTNVAQLLQAPTGSIRAFKVENTLAENGSTYTVKGEVTLTHTNRSIMAKGNLTGKAKINCSRCLKPYTCKLNIKLEEEYFPTIDIVTGVRLPEPEDASSFRIDEHHVIDLTEAIRQYIVTAMPMKPLCKESCAGLCSTCGKDLNKGRCNCHQDELDPRWAELLKLKNNDKIKITSDKGR